MVVVVLIAVVVVVIVVEEVVVNDQAGMLGVAAWIFAGLTFG